MDEERISYNTYGEAKLAKSISPEKTIVEDTLYKVWYLAEPAVLSIDQLITGLWTACSNYEKGNGSNGTAPTFFVSEANNGNVKAVANVEWRAALWAEYYIRKALVESELDHSLDFSKMGSEPHTCEEVMNEGVS